MRTIIMGLLTAVLLTATASLAQEPPALPEQARPSPAREERRNPACDTTDNYVLLTTGESGLGVWRNPRTGDVLIRGNLFGAQRDAGPADDPACERRKERGPRERKR